MLCTFIFSDKQYRMHFLQKRIGASSLELYIVSSKLEAITLLRDSSLTAIRI